MGNGPQDERPHVVVIGGGFGGLRVVRRLRHAPVRITLVDRQNHYLFQPLLYQVATGGLGPDEIAQPIRRILRGQPNVEVLLAEATQIDLANRRVRLADGELGYDFLVLATGASHSYFGHDEWAPVAPGLKTVDDALEIRRRVLMAFEHAEREPDPRAQAAWLTFVVVGAGPTGVELAGALAEMLRLPLRRDFRHVHFESARVVLVEALPRVLPTFSESLAGKAQAQLERLGVTVRTGARVSAIDADGLTAGGERTASRTVLWAAGVAASPLARTLGVPLDARGRVVVEPDLSLPGHPEAMAVGDLAAARSCGKPVPGVAQAAMQQGRHAALGILQSLAGRGRAPFRYRDRGELATIGRKAAVGRVDGVELSGGLAWLVWLVVHLFYVNGARNRSRVLIDWGFAYFAHERGARIITGLTPPRTPAEAPLRPAPAAGQAGQDGQGAAP
jgi:NADH dehydrogenase